MGRSVLIWTAVASATLIPLAAAALSPQLQWRHPIYIAAGFAGIIALALLFVQPLLMGGHLPGLSGLRARRVHRAVGGLLLAAVLVHVAALWVTSAPDVIDALLFQSPTPFSAWGVIAMWAIFATAVLAALRRRLRLHPRTWRLCHGSLAAVIVACTIVHAVLIDGTMETVSKVVLCALVALATLTVLAGLRR